MRTAAKEVTQRPLMSALLRFSAAYVLATGACLKHVSLQLRLYGTWLFQSSKRAHQLLVGRCDTASVRLGLTWCPLTALCGRTKSLMPGIGLRCITTPD